MQGLNLMIVMLALGSASACKYYCRTPGTFKYECCDDGNPYYKPESQSEASEIGEDPVDVPSDGPTQAPSNCYYYCAYDGEVYCCGDTSQPIPESHANHDGDCPEDDEQVCKSDGVYYLLKKYKAKTNGALRLTKGDPQEMNFCASDGYCGKYEKCCPSKCKKGHICMKALDVDEEEKEKDEE